MSESTFDDDISDEEFYKLITKWGKIISPTFEATSPESCYKSIDNCRIFLRWFHRLVFETGIRDYGSLIRSKLVNLVIVFIEEFFE
jgi:hypothetical protein